MRYLITGGAGFIGSALIRHISENLNNVVVNVDSLTYAGNLDYFSCVKNSSKIVIDSHEFFHKQSFKNRCQIYGANGLLNLTVPIQRKKGKTPVKDVQIEHSFNWQKVHWKSLESSYRSSPYFEFYEEEFKPLYLEKKIEYLLDFNQQINLVLLRCLNMDTEVIFSDSYIEKGGKVNDFRDIIHPSSVPTETVKKMKYSQVFQESQDFIYNLSIFDLLFNQGPLAKQLLDS